MNANLIYLLISAIFLLAFLTVTMLQYRTSARFLHQRLLDENKRLEKEYERSWHYRDQSEKYQRMNREYKRINQEYRELLCKNNDPA